MESQNGSRGPTPNPSNTIHFNTWLKEEAQKDQKGREDFKKWIKEYPISIDIDKGNKIKIPEHIYWPEKGSDNN